MSNSSLVEWFGLGSGHHCGYCKSADTNLSHGMWAHYLMVDDYQDLINRGWRRSGKYLYKPLLNKICCPMYTIRCDIANFQVSFSQKKVIKHVNKFLNYNIKPGKSGSDNSKNDNIITGEQVNEPITPDFKIISSLTPEHIINQTSLNIQQIENSQDDSINHLDESQNKSKVSDFSNEHAEQSPDSPSNDNSFNKIDTSEKLDNFKSSDSVSNDNSFNKMDTSKRLDNLKYGNKVKRKILKKLNNPDKETSKKKNINKKKSLEDLLNEVIDTPAHKLEIKIVESNQSNVVCKSTLSSSYKNYVSYQTSIHHDEPQECTVKQFIRFLVDSPLIIKDESSDSSDHAESFRSTWKGSFHQQYWLDGEMIAVGVIDILPDCISSVYFYYNPEYSFLTLGTYSSLREIAFARKLQSMDPSMKYYYMGFYIHSCTKMRYKGQYSNSYLLCPEAYSWHPIKECLPTLEVTKYARFEKSQNEEEEKKEEGLDKVQILYKHQVILYKVFKKKFGNSEQQEVSEFAKLTGKKSSQRIILYRK